MPLPTADFTSEVNEGCEGIEIAFTNLSLNADSWHWDFGDGTTSSNENPSHVYNTSGLYTVSLTAYNNCGDDTVIKIDYITIHAGPTADFEAAPRTGESPLTVDFSDLSTSLLGIRNVHRKKS
jgi:PKD repeat protein